MTYIDHIFITGPNCAKLESFVKQFSSVFASKDLDKLSYFLGIEVLYYQGSIYFFHKKYIRGLLVKVNMLECKGVNTPMSSRKDSRLQKTIEGEIGYYIEDPTNYRSIVGGLQYFVLTKLEITYSIHKLSQYVSSPKLQNLMACKMVLRYLKKHKIMAWDSSNKTFSKSQYLQMLIRPMT